VEKSGTGATAAASAPKAPLPDQDLRTCLDVKTLRQGPEGTTHYFHGRSGPPERSHVHRMLADASTAGGDSVIILGRTGRGWGTPESAKAGRPKKKEKKKKKPKKEKTEKRKQKEGKKKRKTNRLVKRGARGLTAMKKQTAGPRTAAVLPLRSPCRIFIRERKLFTRPHQLETNKA